MQRYEFFSIFVLYNIVNMEQLSKGTMWNTAGKAGLALAAASTAYLLANQFMSQAEIPAFLNSILGFVLWAAKFVGCIWIMKFFMKKYVSKNRVTGNGSTFRLGVMMALLSAILYSGAAFANVAFISADLFDEQMAAMMQQMAPMMDSNTMSMMDTYMENLPQITFVSNFIYCFIFGTVLSYILSRNIPSKDPFAEYKPDEQ